MQLKEIVFQGSIGSNKKFSNCLIYWVEFDFSVKTSVAKLALGYTINSFHSCIGAFDEKFSNYLIC
jgi:hypothetical protein